MNCLHLPNLIINVINNIQIRHFNTLLMISFFHSRGSKEHTIVRLCNCKVIVIKRFKCYKWALQKKVPYIKIWSGYSALCSKGVPCIL